MQETIDASVLRLMFLTGTKYLDDKKELVNELNVFPVPDGDTGTNMTLTLMSAARNLADEHEELSVKEICSRISSGTLRGARGNSGVIMSQLCRGFAKVIENAQTVGLPLLSDAFDGAVASAYNAVLKPVEGTMLTVARGAAEKARELSLADISLKEYFFAILEYARQVLQRTPDMLPVLKEAGVVDSGGQGLVEFLTGAYDAFTGNVTSISFEPSAPAREVHVDVSNISTSDIKFTYCTEFIVECRGNAGGQQETALRKYLDSIGDSVVCVGMDDIIKVHVHTNHPGQAIERALELGELSSLKIDNMKIEHHQRVIENPDEWTINGSEDVMSDAAKSGVKDTLHDAYVSEEPIAHTAAAASNARYGFICVSPGEGITDIFRSLGADVVIDGGQTMNPSTDDFLDAISRIPAQKIFIIPNNSNIILAANQAREIKWDQDIYVIPSVNICQGISAMINFDPDAEITRNTQAMKEALESVKCAEITYAVRGARINGKRIRKGDYMGIVGKDVVSVTKDASQAAKEAVQAMADEESQIITLYYGENITEEEAQAVAEELDAAYEADIVTAYGGQKVYSYIISVE